MTDPKEYLEEVNNYRNELLAKRDIAKIHRLDATVFAIASQMGWQIEAKAEDGSDKTKRNRNRR